MVVGEEEEGAGEDGEGVVIVAEVVVTSQHAVILFGYPRQCNFRSLQKSGYCFFARLQSIHPSILSKRREV